MLHVMQETTPLNRLRINQQNYRDIRCHTYIISEDTETWEDPELSVIKFLNTGMSLQHPIAEMEEDTEENLVPLCWKSFYKQDS